MFTVPKRRSRWAHSDDAFCGTQMIAPTCWADGNRDYQSCLSNPLHWPAAAAFLPARQHRSLPLRNPVPRQGQRWRTRSNTKEKAMAQMKIGIIVGSLRIESFNRKLANALM